ncbi:DUF1330 domain-containing protein [Prolixibacteraceae bacterium JC049]|nr:DUF1330 domain-containing protein [Prolixibacteraceae bacterium JC049]
MSKKVYFVANIKINNAEEYDKYIAEAGEVFSKYKGTYLVVENSPVLLEGSWNYTRNVIIQFESKDDFDAWYYSDEYQKILKHRLKGAECDTILVDSLG